GDLGRPGGEGGKTCRWPYSLKNINKMNDPQIRAQPIVSFGGIGNASALAKFYFMIANGLLFVFFFQAEDGIRDSSVIGVQTCALPISGRGGCLRRPGGLRQVHALPASRAHAR